MPPRIPPHTLAVEQVILRWTTGRISLSRPSLLVSHRSLPSQCLNASRKFSQTPLLHRKGAKAAKQEARSSGTEGEAEDPHDFSTLDVGIKRALDRLQEELSKLRTGGRFNPELLEGIRVQLKKDNKSTIRLGDLAQVVPKGGKSVVVLVGEADHVKPIVSAIQGSKDLNLQPQQDPHNALQLNIPIPPPTKESRDLAIGSAVKVGEKANTDIRDARAAMQKRLRGIELKKSARPDDLKKAHKDMEKVVERGNADVKKIVETAKKAMEQS